MGYKSFFAVVFLLFVLTRANADPLIFVPSDSLANDTLTSIIANDVLEDATTWSAGSSGNPTGGSRKSTKVPAPQKRPTATVNKLASTYPADVRPEAKRVFTQLYVGYGKIEKKLGIPKYDLAGAVAAFIAGSYMAFNDVDVTDADFKVLVNQTRQALRSSRGFAKLKPAKKRALYEQLAIIGTFVATTRIVLQQQPNADLSFQLQAAGRAYLEQLLNVSADRVVINSGGLAII